MNISQFTCKVERLGYKKFENQNQQTKEREPIIYMCNTTVSEIGRGMGKFKTFHNIVFILNEQEFAEKCIEKNDRITIMPTAKWKSTKLEYKSYNPEMINKADKSKLKSDEKGKTYYEDVVFAYKVKCRANDWQMETKWYDQYYCTIKDSRIKLPLEEKKQFSNKVLEFFLDDDEVNKIKEFSGKTCTLLGYGNGNKFDEKQVDVNLTIEDELNAKKLTIQNRE